MNYENFSAWVKNQLLPNLPTKSVLVIDNASYHNVCIDKHPTSASTKKEMLAWLAERNIFHNPKDTNPELYKIIKSNKPAHRPYKLDTLLHEHGHSTLRLPPYHPELNPIEKIWATVKNWVAVRNITFKLADVKQLAIEKFNAITAAEWSAISSHVDKVVDEYVRKENILDDALEHLQFTVNTGESSDSASGLSGVEAISDSGEET